MNVIERKVDFDQIEFSRAEPEYPIKGIGRADLVLFDKDDKPWLVIETKSSLKVNDPYNPKVIDQALRYASWLGAYYFATCDGKDFVLFDNKERGVTFWERKRIPPYDLRKERSLEEFAEKLLRDIVHLELGIKKWSPPDEAFISRLKTLHERLVPPLFESITSTLKADRKFTEKYEEWLDKQGFHMNKQTHHKIAVEAAYLLINKILFYKVLETKYKDLPKLKKVSILLEKDVVTEFKKRVEECFKKALKIDYQAVFHHGIYDDIPLPYELVPRLNEFLDEAAGYDLSKIESDVLGTIYEGLIPKDERRRLGQYYTPPAICDLIVKMCVNDPNAMVLDPGCGSGGFLIKGYHRLLELKGKKTLDDEAHQEILKQLWGIDISEFPAHLSVINLALRNIKARSDMINVIPSDFFRVIPQQKVLKPLKKLTLEEAKDAYELPPQFDVVVCNPPYTRQDDIGDERYRANIRKIALASDGKINISSEAGIYAYFFTHSSHFLKQNGMLGYIVSNSWLDVKFGIALQRFFLNNFRLIAIIEFDRRAFAEAAINTIIIIAQKMAGEAHKKQRNENKVKFVRIKMPLKTEEIIKLIEKANMPYENETVRIVLKKQSELYEDTKWMKFLRAPPIFFEITENPKMCSLEEFAKVNVGIITYANDFFILQEDKARDYGIERDFLKPVVTSPKDTKFLDIVSGDINKYIFYANMPKQKLNGTNALKYIIFGENKEIEITRGAERGTIVKGYHNIPSLRTKKQWYSVGERKTAPVLVPRLIWERIFAAENTANALCTHAFYEITPLHNTDCQVLLGILNSSISELCAEVIGRTALGEGCMELMEQEWNKLSIINPTKLNRMERRNVKKSFLKLKEAKRKDDERVIQQALKELDDVMVEILGLKIEKEQIYKAIEEMRQIRKRRVETEILIEHPETRKRTRQKQIGEFKPRPKDTPLEKWFKKD
jgi:type I restriction-modification system DNA methylase subunit